MLINVEVSGLEKLAQLINRVDPIVLREKICDMVYRELSSFAESIRADPNIPQEVKDALFLYVNYESGNVGLGIFWESEDIKWLRWGVIQYKQYKCPVRKYWGGTLKKAYTGPTYVRELWNRNKASIISRVRSSIIELIRSG